MNSQSKLFVLREAPQTLLPKLFKAWKISHLVFEKDTDAYARERDETITRLAIEAGVEVVSKTGRTLYDPDELVKANGGHPTMSISQVEHVRSPFEIRKRRELTRPLGRLEDRGYPQAYRKTHVSSKSRRHSIEFQTATAATRS